MSEYYWNKKVEYLQKSRGVFWNLDYLKFLVKNVWKINTKVRVADFGCGNGYLGSVLMPMLPKGSIYTGFDKGEKLILNAQTHFTQAPFRSRFIQTDLIEDELQFGDFDVVICQTVLMHIPEPIRMLKRMVSATKKGGLVICIEPNWNVSNAGLYIDGIDADRSCNLGILQKLWEQELAASKIDRCVGLKVPSMMRSCGLKEIGIRENDCVRLINPDAPEQEYKRQLETFLSEGWGRDPVDEQEAIMNLCNRGLTKEEAKIQYDAEEEINAYIAEHTDEFLAVSAPSMFISYGRKG